MKCLVLYDSTYGNTRKVAETIASSLNATLAHIDKTKADQVAEADLLIVGSPTQGGKPTVELQAFLDKLPDDVLAGKPAAAFDTRFAINEHGAGLKLVMKTIGFAAPKLSSELKKRGCVIVDEPEGFIVNDTQGPLQRHELSRAVEWAHEVKLGATVNA